MGSIAKNPLLIGLACLAALMSCAEAEFTSKAKSVVASSPEEDALPEAQPQPEPPIEIVEECKEKIELPDAPTALKEVFNWKASGPTAEYTQVMATTVAGPLKPSDTVSSIVFPAFKDCDYRGGGAYLYAVDGKTGAQKWVSSFKVIPSASAAIANIDGDSDNEVVAVGIDQKLYALRPDGSIKWVSAEVSRVIPHDPYIYTGGPAVADLDGDGKVEIAMSGGVFNGADGSLKFRMTEATNAVIIADTDGQPGLEVVTSAAIYKADGKELCKLPVPIVFQGAARLKASDKVATIVGRSGVNVVAINGATCSLIFSNAFPGGDGGGPYNFADFNGDGTLEFGAAGGKNYATFLPDGNVFWTKPTKDASSRSTGATTFDFNADGKNEVVYNDEDFLRIFDGATGAVLFENKNSSGTLYEYPIIVDADGDGRANIIVGANNCFAYTNRSAVGVRMFQSPQNNWVGTRTIWNQHAYDPLLVGEKGEIVGVNQDAIWKEWVADKHLVGFRNNIPKPRKSSACQ